MVKANAKTYFSNAQDLLKSGKPKEARKLLQEILKSNPRQLDSLLLLGQCLLVEGKYEDALSSFDKGLEVRPNGINLLILKAQALMKLRMSAEAEEVLSTGFDATGNLQFKVNIGVVKCQNGEYELALQFLEIADLKTVGNAVTWLSRAKSMAALGREDEAALSYQESLKLDPRNKVALNNLANLFHKNGAYKKAIELYQELIKHHPSEGMAFSNLAGLHEKVNDPQRALELYNKAVSLSPDLSMAWYNMAHLLGKRMKKYSDCLKVCQEGLSKGEGAFLEPLRYLEILSKQHLNDWSTYEEDQKDLQAIITNYLAREKNQFEIVPFDLSFSQVDGQDYRKISERFASSIVEKSKDQVPKIPYDLTLSEGKIKLGYYSSGFKDYAGGFLVREFFDHHDPSIFEVHAFSLVHTEDAVNQEIRDSVDYYHDVSKMSSREISDLINRTGIDVLISLRSYNENMRMEVLALRPAPIQMMMIGSHETTGAPFIDYIFSDSSMMDKEVRKNFSEHVITLPSPLLMSSPLPKIDARPTTRSDHQLPENAFVFASFNHPKKIDPTVFGCWCKILKSVPDSVLWIYDAGQETIRKNILHNAQERGVKADQVIFAEPASVHEHWERIQHADLYLDTFVCNAHFTAVEILRSGKPILTLRGKNHNSRLCSSLLHFAGLDKLVVESTEDYVNKAISFASGDGVDEVAQKLMEQNSAFFDTKLQVKYLEKAIRLVLHEYSKNGQFEDLIVKNTLKFDLFS